MEGRGGDLVAMLWVRRYNKVMITNRKWEIGRKRKDCLLILTKRSREKEMDEVRTKEKSELSNR